MCLDAGMTEKTPIGEGNEEKTWLLGMLMALAELRLTRFREMAAVEEKLSEMDHAAEDRDRNQESDELEALFAGRTSNNNDPR